MNHGKNHGKSPSRASWKKGKQAPGFWSSWKDRQRPETPYRSRLARYLLAFLFLVSGFTFLLLRSQTKVQFRALAITKYAAPVAPNFFAQEDMDRFQAAFARSDVDFASIVDPDGADPWQAISGQWGTLKPGGPGSSRWSKNGAVMLYISAHGVVNERGEPCLLANGHDPLDSSTWWRVSELLEAVKSANPDLREATKLVILDAGKMPENWQMGVLSNSFAERLPAIVRAARAGDPNLFVLNSARLNQRTWTSPEMNASFFGFCVAAGLRGAADRSPPDRRISLLELRDYVASEVDALVRDHREGREQPLLIPDDDPRLSKILLAVCPRHYQAPKMEAVPWNVEDIQLLEELGEKRDTLSQRGGSPIYVTHPLRWSKVNQTFRRLDELLLAGGAYSDEFRKQLTYVDGELETLERLKWPIKLDHGSIPLARQAGILSRQELENAQQVFQDWRSAKAEGQEIDLKNGGLTYLAASAAAWDWLRSSSEPVDLKAVQKALDFLNFVEPLRVTLDPPEVHLLKLFCRGLDWQNMEEIPFNALRAEQFGFQVTAEHDVRSHYLTEEMLRKADRKLRKARDALFIGSDTAPVSTWDTLADEWKQIDETKQKISAAYNVRDKCWSELPELARWWLTQQPSKVDTLTKLITTTQALADKLAKLDEEDFELSSIEEDVKAIDISIGQLQDAVSRRVDELLGEEVGAAQDLKDMELLLRGTLLTGEQRNQIRETYLEQLETRGDDLRERLSQRPSDLAISPEARDRGPETVAAHPALELLDPSWLPADERSPVKPPDLSKHETEWQKRVAIMAYYEQAGGTIRERLAGLKQKIEQLIQMTDEKLEKEPVVIARVDLTHADRMARTAAGLMADPLQAGDPCRQLFDLDVGNLVLWHAARSLDNFWGSDVLEDAPDEPYFASAAQRALDAVNVDPIPLFRKRQLSRKRKDLIQAAKNWDKPNVTDPYISNNNPIAELPASLPTLLKGTDAEVYGDAAFAVRGSEGQEIPLFERRSAQGTARFRWRYSMAGPNREKTFSFAVDGETRDSLPVATCFYRGHLRSAPFYLRRAVENTTVFAAPRYGNPTVRVSEQGELTSQVVFVFDCSWSMKEPMRTERGGTRTRLELARDQLTTIVARLERAKGYQIGLVLYGHRAGWKGDKLHPNNPAGLYPGADVQLVIRPRAGVLNAVKLATAGLQPRGETPLYYAIKKALGAFDDALEGPRHVVVISDGVDEQSLDVRPATARTTKRDVLSRLDQLQQNHRVDVILLGKPEAEELKKVEDLREICRRSGGNFHSAGNEGDLIGALEDSLFDIKFFVREAESPDPTPDKFRPLRERFEVVEFSKEGDYDVELRGRKNPPKTSLKLEGGEAIELQYDRRRNILTYPRYRKDVRSTQRVGGYEIRSHKLQKVNRDVTVEVSIQTRDETRFSPRPRHIWAELTPLPARPGRPASVYYFQDRRFLDNVPVPLIQLKADEFPTTRAELRLWFSFAEDVHKLKVPLDDLEAAGESKVIRYQDAELTCAMEKVGPQRIRFIIVEPDSSLYPLRIQMDPPADLVKRTYTQQRRVARHEFHYTRDLPSSPDLRIGLRYDKTLKWNKCAIPYRW